MQLDNIEFVLVRPVFLGNIGASARVLKNFGFRNLSLVAPPKNYKDAEARKMSVGAFDILKQAKLYETLGEALENVALSIATSSGQQRQRPLKSLCSHVGSNATIDGDRKAINASNTAEDAANISIKELISRTSENQKVAIVFGDERNGLTNEEVERCHEVITIASDSSFPSLNVSHALAVVAYEIAFAKNHAAWQAKQEYPSLAPALATGKQDDELFSILEELFETIEFSRTYNKELVIRQLRSAYQRMRPTSRETQLLTGVVHRLTQKLLQSQTD